MDPVTLKLLHIAGVLCLFTSLGATLLAKSGSKTASMLHGIALILILLAGFAILKKPPMDHYWWMVKIVLWLFLGAAPAIAKRTSIPTIVVLLLSIGVGIFAAYLGRVQPF